MARMRARARRSCPTLDKTPTGISGLDQITGDRPERPDRPEQREKRERPERLGQPERRGQPLYFVILGTSSPSCQPV
jgi:hypothetical protein